VRELDLTPFGFTPTEGLAYRALTELGPLTGYALAQVLAIARANAYQALRGLVAKGAVTKTAERPERYRPLQPGALLALIAEREARELDRLEAALSTAPAAGGPAIIPIMGERALLDVAMRTAAREEGPVLCLAPGRVLVALAPAWHKRAHARAETALWVLGDHPSMTLPIPLAGRLDPAAVTRFFPELPFVLAASQVAIIASLVGSGTSGCWTSNPVLVHSISATASLLTLTQSPAEQ
jgi:sugar-specific transcriptional regulator TrmB